MTRKTWTVLALALAASVATACGGAAPTAPAASTPQASSSRPAAPTATASQPAAQLQHVTLRLPWLVSGHDVGFIVAKAKGYYKSAGLDVSIEEGKGSVTAAETVANGSDTFGFVDAGAAATLISKGLPVKFVEVLNQKTPASFIHNPDVKIASPADLKGKTIVSTAGDLDLQLLPAVLKQAGLTKADVKIVMVDPAALPQTIVQHPSYVLMGLVNDMYVRVSHLDPKAVDTPFASFGVSTLSLGVATSLNELSRHPDVVRSFVAATNKGWEYAIAHAAEAVADEVKAFPNADPAITAGAWNNTIPLIHTPASEGHPLGWTAPSDWQKTLNILHQYGALTTVKPVNDYFTNAFIPAQ